MLDYNSFNPADYNPDVSYGIIPTGDYRVRIDNAEEQISRNSGREMIKLTLSVAGYNSKLWSYTVLDDSSAEAIKRTNHYLGVIFDSFAITQGDFNLQNWIGHVGGVRVRHRIGTDGEPRAEVHYFLRRKDVDALPAWNSDENFDAQPVDLVDGFDDQHVDSTHIPF